jgi:hypothetical protein
MSGFFGDKIKSECRIESECVESEERGQLTLKVKGQTVKSGCAVAPGFIRIPSLLVC